QEIATSYIRVVGVIRGDAGAEIGLEQLDAELAVVVDAVCEDRDAERIAGNLDSVCAVAGNHVCETRLVASDHDLAAGSGNSGKGVGERGQARCVGSDDVVDDHGCGAGVIDPRKVVAGDESAMPHGWSADVGAGRVQLVDAAGHVLDAVRLVAKVDVPGG